MGKRLLMGCLALVLVVTGLPADAQAPDPFERQQWALGAMGVPSAWSKATGRGVVVAVLDAGVDAAATDLKGALLRGTDVVHPGAYITDGGHGTYYASLIAARRNRVGIVGVAPQATVLPVKVQESGASFSGVGVSETGGAPDQVADGIEYAVNHGAKVIVVTAPPWLMYESMARLPLLDESLTNLQAAIGFADRKGVAVVFPAGDTATPTCPPYLPRTATALCVGATDRRGNHAVYSSFDAQLDRRMVVAPGGSGLGYYVDEMGRYLATLVTASDPSGEDVVGTVAADDTTDYDEDGVIPWAGTAVAAAHVAGVLALLVSRGLTPKQAVTRVIQTAKDLGPAGRDALYGFGLVDAAAAVR